MSRMAGPACPINFICSIILMAAACGCGTDPSGPGESGPGLTAYLGSYDQTGGDDAGAVMIDVILDGRRATAEVVIRSRRNEYPFDHLFLKGSVENDAVHLSIDRDRTAASFQFDMQIAPGTGGVITGSFTHSGYGITAEMECYELDQTDSEVDTFIDLSAVALGMAFDGENVWMSTSGEDYFLIDSTAALVDTVAVLFEGGAHWTSDALASDSTFLWGQYPVTISGTGGSRNESDIIEFDRAGEIRRRFRVGHRISGLAWSGAGLWSLSTRSDTLYGLDMQGSVLETVPIAVPDLVDIVFDGTDFWGIGWFMKRLYRMSSAGEIVSVCHIPGEQGIIFPSGLTFDGKRFWYSFNTSYLDTRIYWLRAQ